MDHRDIFKISRNPDFDTCAMQNVNDVLPEFLRKRGYPFRTTMNSSTIIHLRSNTFFLRKRIFAMWNPVPMKSTQTRHASNGVQTDFRRFVSAFRRIEVWIVSQKMKINKKKG